MFLNVRHDIHYAAAFAQAGHYLSTHPCDNEQITAFDHWIEDP
jgi:hypothetical protein